MDWNGGVEWWNCKFGKMRLEGYEVWEKDIHDIICIIIDSLNDSKR